MPRRSFRIKYLAIHKPLRSWDDPGPATPLRNRTLVYKAVLFNKHDLERHASLQAVRKQLVWLGDGGQSYPFKRL